MFTERFTKKRVRDCSGFTNLFTDILGSPQGDGHWVRMSIQGPGQCDQTQENIKKDKDKHNKLMSEGKKNNKRHNMYILLPVWHLSPINPDGQTQTCLFTVALYAQSPLWQGDGRPQSDGFSECQTTIVESSHVWTRLPMTILTLPVNPVYYVYCSNTYVCGCVCVYVCLCVRACVRVWVDSY